MQIPEGVFCLKVPEWFHTTTAVNLLLLGDLLTHEVIAAQPGVATLNPG
jgi:hypothetical protein